MGLRKHYILTHATGAQWGDKSILPLLDDALHTLAVKGVISGGKYNVLRKLVPWRHKMRSIWAAVKPFAKDIRLEKLEEFKHQKGANGEYVSWAKRRYRVRRVVTMPAPAFLRPRATPADAVRGRVAHRPPTGRELLAGLQIRAREHMANQQAIAPTTTGFQIGMLPPVVPLTPGRVTEWPIRHREAA